ncbi:MAG: branched-chain amino acid ABC transporter permease [Erysipelotrichaceae bacterium]|nr:branched-chain amino acid ABC transporter permease [Erysipelotrichaceae bacterium]
MKNMMNFLFGRKNRSRTISFLIIIAAYIFIQVLTHTVRVSRLFTSLLVPTCCYIVLALSLNLVVGFSGELSLGHAGFMAVGAFTAVSVSGLMSSVIANDILRLIVSIVVGSIVAAIFGLIISVPVLKLSGDYLAIVTLAFGQIIKSLINNVFLGFDKNGLHFSFVTNELNMDGGKMLLSGPMGATDTAKISNFSAGIILILITLFAIYSLINSRYGRAIMASRDDRIAASSIGIKVSSIKTLAFVTSAFLAGMAGALYALNYSTLQPAKFDFNTSILALVYVVFGGLGNINGTIISTTVLYILPELLRSLQDYRMLIYAVVLIVVMQLTNSAKVRAALNKVSDSIFKKGASK